MTTTPDKIEAAAEVDSLELERVTKQILEDRDCYDMLIERVADNEAVQELLWRIVNNNQFGVFLDVRDALRNAAYEHAPVVIKCRQLEAQEARAEDLAERRGR